ncbi:hypothetical protein [Gordonibacter sp. 28C]|uniref:hypothetical protein n=1 Tax=Gordonibacter sp. 28C TaxID=2078569 RepID=UPI0011C081B1|nr:hypothetical protein [Gordonibacter sp. 28C]
MAKKILLICKALHERHWFEMEAKGDDMPFLKEAMRKVNERFLAFVFVFVDGYSLRCKSPRHQKKTEIPS